MTPYTREAVTLIRSAINHGQPADAVRQSLGWDTSMFDNVCRRHGIDGRAANVDDERPAPKAKPAPSIEPAVTPKRFDYVTVHIDEPVRFRLRRHAQAAGLTAPCAAQCIIDSYLAGHSPTEIGSPGRRRSFNESMRVAQNINVTEESYRILFAEARMRGRGNSAGRLVNAIISQHFGGVT